MRRATSWSARRRYPLLAGARMGMVGLVSSDTLAGIQEDDTGGGDVEPSGASPRKIAPPSLTRMPATASALRSDTCTDTASGVLGKRRLSTLRDLASDAVSRPPS